MPNNISLEDRIILLEHNIPLLFLTKINNKFFLHYFIDEDEEKETYRYLYIQIPTMRIRALITQGITLYDCLTSPEQIYVYDIDFESKIICSVNIPLEDIPEEALPDKEEYLPQLTQNIIDLIFGFETGDLSFILSGEDLTNHTISFEKLSKFLQASQKIAVETTNHYCDIKSLNHPQDIELRVEAQKAASFAINSNVNNNITLVAMNEIIPQYTDHLLRYNSTEIYDLLDKIPTGFAKHLFNFFSILLSNKYEAIIKIKNHSFYLNTNRIKQIKKNVNDANYTREEPLTVTGYLVGGNIKTNYFYFVDHQSGTTYRGRFSEEFSLNHAELTLSDEQLKIAKFKSLIEFKFSSFNQTYELISLETPVISAGVQ